MLGLLAEENLFLSQTESLFEEQLKYFLANRFVFWKLEII